MKYGFSYDYGETLGCWLLGVIGIVMLFISMRLNSSWPLIVFFVPLSVFVLMALYWYVEDKIRAWRE